MIKSFLSHLAPLAPYINILYKILKKDFQVSSIKLELVTYYGHESDREEHRSHERTINLRLDTGSEESEACCTDVDTSEYR